MIVSVDKIGSSLSSVEKVTPAAPIQRMKGRLGQGAGTYR